VQSRMNTVYFFGGRIPDTCRMQTVRQLHTYPRYYLNFPKLSALTIPFIIPVLFASFSASYLILSPVTLSRESTSTSGFPPTPVMASSTRSTVPKQGRPIWVEWDVSSPPAQPEYQWFRAFVHNVHPVQSNDLQCLSGGTIQYTEVDSTCTTQMLPLAPGRRRTRMVTIIIPE